MVTRSRTHCVLALLGVLGIAGSTGFAGLVTGGSFESPPDIPDGTFDKLHACGQQLSGCER